jgi:TatA/E family protein of Tat protein translocase
VIANLAGFDLGAVIVIAVIVLVGGSQLPKIARNIGLAGKEFRKAQDDAEQEHAKEQAAKAAAAIPPPTPVGPAPAPSAASPAGQPPEDSVVLTRAELDALLKAREQQATQEATGGATGPASSN